MDKNWQNDPKLKDMDRSKLEMLQNLAEQGNGKSPSDMLPFLMSAAAQGKNSGLNFSPDEISAVLEVLNAADTVKNLIIFISQETSSL